LQDRCRERIRLPKWPVCAVCAGPAQRPDPRIRAGRKG